MSFRCLSEFLEELGRAGELARVEAEVDPRLEIAEITARVRRADGPALLFPAVRGHEIPVLTNLLGSEVRLCRALGVAGIEEIGERLARLVEPGQTAGWLDRLRAAAPGATWDNFLPRRVKTAPCQQIVRLGKDVDLGQLPLLQAATEDVGRAIPAACVYAADADSHRQTSVCCDLVPLERDSLAVCWLPSDEPSRLLAEYRRRAAPMPLAVVLGGDPAGVLAASARWSPEIDPLALAGLLRNKPLDAVACRGVDLVVPAEAEFVLEGQIDAAEPCVDVGPLATPLGYYGRASAAPVMRVSAITHRANPIYWAMVPGSAASEAARSPGR